MKILVTGGAGYIGSHVVLELCDSGFEVIVFDDLSLGFRENVDQRAELLIGSTLNKKDLDDVFSQNIDAVVHLAAWKAAGESMEDPHKYAQNNVIGTLNVLDSMREHGVQKFILSSTAAVYGYPEYLPIDEHHPVEPVNYYGYTKLVIEQNLKWFSELKGARYASLRYFNAAGYDLVGRVSTKEKNPQNLLPVVMEVAGGIRKNMEVFGDDYDTPDGTGVRDYIHVNDLASAHVSALNYLVEKNENLIVNLATGVGYSVLDVIKEAEKVTKKKISYEIVGRREGDPAELTSISMQAKKLLNWEAKHSDLYTLLSTMWEVYK